MPFHLWWLLTLETKAAVYLYSLQTLNLIEFFFSRRCCCWPRCHCCCFGVAGAHTHAHMGEPHRDEKSSIWVVCFRHSILHCQYVAWQIDWSPVNGMWFVVNDNVVCIQRWIIYPHVMCSTVSVRALNAPLSGWSLCKQASARTHTNASGEWVSAAESISIQPIGHGIQCKDSSLTTLDEPYRCFFHSTSFFVVRLWDILPLIRWDYRLGPVIPSKAYDTLLCPLLRAGMFRRTVIEGAFPKIFIQPFCFDSINWSFLFVPFRLCICLVWWIKNLASNTPKQTRLRQSAIWWNPKLLFTRATSDPFVVCIVNGVH